MHSISIRSEGCESLSRIREQSSTREMNKHHMFRVPLFKELSDIVKVKMSADSSSSTMILVEERALRYDDSRLGKFIPL